MLPLDRGTLLKVKVFKPVVVSAAEAAARDVSVLQVEFTRNSWALISVILLPRPVMLSSTVYVPPARHST